jgi:hypothetical protein
MSAGRFKNYDYGVVGLFALVLVGVSLSWYTVSISFENQSLEGGVSGWHYAWGILAFVAALIALMVVCVKGLLVPGSLLPGWYKQGPIVMGLGDLVTLFAVIGFIQKPGRGVDLLGIVKVGYGVGIFLTLIAGLLMGGCGILARRDRSGASSGTPSPSGMGGSAGTWHAGPLLSTDWPAGEAPGWAAPGGVAPAGTGGRASSSGYCQTCGVQLDAGSRFCQSCGLPQG